MPGVAPLLIARIESVVARRTGSNNSGAEKYKIPHET